jgi:hypothetical protein
MAGKRSKGWGLVCAICVFLNIISVLSICYFVLYSQHWGFAAGYKIILCSLLFTPFLPFKNDESTGLFLIVDRDVWIESIRKDNEYLMTYAVFLGSYAAAPLCYGFFGGIPAIICISLFIHIVQVFYLGSKEKAAFIVWWAEAVFAIVSVTMIITLPFIILSALLIPRLSVKKALWFNKQRTGYTKNSLHLFYAFYGALYNLNEIEKERKSKQLYFLTFICMLGVISVRFYIL